MAIIFYLPDPAVEDEWIYELADESGEVHMSSLTDEEVEQAVLKLIRLTTEREPGARQIVVEKEPLKYEETSLIGALFDDQGDEVDGQDLVAGAVTALSELAGTSESDIDALTRQQAQTMLKNLQVSARALEFILQNLVLRRFDDDELDRGAQRFEQGLRNRR